MGRKWNNIKYGKAAKDAARSKVLARFGKEIYMAAKNGDPDPELNRNLASVIDRAKVAGVNREIIDRAINKAKGGSDENYDFIRYEGYGPNGAAVIVDTLTDNVNRTVAEVRSAFNKNGRRRWRNHSIRRPRSIPCRTNSIKWNGNHRIRSCRINNVTNINSRIRWWCIS